jgi:hypothetical protein
MNRWLHETLDIIIWGRSYWWLHQEIDEPSKIFGICHRKYNHDWYREFKKCWDWENPFPKDKTNKEITEIIRDIPDELRETFNKLLIKETEKLQEKGLVKEAFQAYITHCFFDRFWDETSKQERKYIENAFITFILNPQLLYEKAGVDINKWKIKVERNGEVWEDSPQLKTDYQNLIRYLNKQDIVKKKLFVS